MLKWGCVHTDESRETAWAAGGLVRNQRWVYLVKTVANAAKLWGKLAGWANDGLEEALSDLKQVPLVLLQVLALFQPDTINQQLSEARKLFNLSQQKKNKQFVSVMGICVTKVYTGGLQPPRIQQCTRYVPGGVHLKTDVFRGCDDPS